MCTCVNLWLRNKLPIKHYHPYVKHSIHKPTTNIPPWRPSARLQRKIDQSFNDHYNQFPCFPCVYAEITIPALVPLFPLDDIVRIGTVSKLSNCRSCKKQATRLHFPSLAPIPQKIIDVPYSKENTRNLFFYNNSDKKSKFVVLLSYFGYV